MVGGAVSGCRTQISVALEGDEALITSGGEGETSPKWLPLHASIL